MMYTVGKLVDQYVLVFIETMETTSTSETDTTAEIPPPVASPDHVTNYKYAWNAPFAVYTCSLSVYDVLRSFGIL